MGEVIRPKQFFEGQETMPLNLDGGSDIIVFGDVVSDSWAPDANHVLPYGTDIQPYFNYLESSEPESCGGFLKAVLGLG